MKVKIFLILMLSVFLVQCENKKQEEAEELIKEIEILQKTPDEKLRDSIFYFEKKYAEFVNIDSVKNEMNSDNPIDRSNAKLMYVVYLEKISERLYKASMYIEDKEILHSFFRKIDSLDKEIYKYKQ